MMCLFLISQHSATVSPDGQQLGYHYQHGRVQGITLNEQPLLAFNHDNAGREQERRQGNGLVNRYQYDSLGVW
ncbi:hypothetical protein [Serratia sp. 2723]|uniref:hypothetical protein n=1 Tax=unclassified Serratia (in: enterobacteria) TaxID=2647522 RepID=UPI003D2178D1